MSLTIITTRTHPFICQPEFHFKFDSLVNQLSFERIVVNVRWQSVDFIIWKKKKTTKTLHKLLQQTVFHFGWFITKKCEAWKPQKGFYLLLIFELWQNPKTCISFAEIFQISSIHSGAAFGFHVFSIWFKHIKLWLSIVPFKYHLMSQTRTE